MAALGRGPIPRRNSLDARPKNRPSVSYPTIGSPMETGPQARPAHLRGLFHELNNQLSVILAHAELMESKSPDA